MKWQQWNHNATLWLTPCLHSKARFSWLGYFGNCVLIYALIAAFQPSELGPNSSFYYGTFTEEKILRCRHSFLPRKWPFIQKTTLSVPTQLSGGITPNKVPAGLPVSDYSRDWMFPALRLWTTCCQLEALPHLPILHPYDLSANLASPHLMIIKGK